MCWINSHFNPISEESEIPFPNLPTACRIHSVSYLVGISGLSVQPEKRNTATLSYT